MDQRVSVVIPHYNHHDYLPKALDSVFKQTEPPDEVIVVDDGSTPSSSAWACRSQFADCGIHLIIIETDHHGIGAALNAGIRQMTGDVFCWLAADDWWMPGKLQQQQAFARQHPECVLHAQCDIYCDGKTIRGQAAAHTDASFRRVIRTSSPYFGSTFWIPAEILAQVGEFNEDVPASEDYQWVLRSVLLHGVRYRFQDEVLAVKRHHAGQTTERYRRDIPQLMRQFNREIDPEFTP